MKLKTAILIGLMFLPVVGKAVDPSVTADSSNNWLPALRNGHAPNLPANTTMGGSPITGVSDGDKGDITVSASGATWTIDAKTISLAKMADMATASFLGRNTAGTGSPEVLSISSVKTMLGIGGAFGTAAYVNTGSTNGTIPLLGTGGHLANATMPLGAQLYDNAGTPTLAADFGARVLKAPDGREMMAYSDPTTLYFLDGAFIIVDTGISDSSAVPALNPTNRQLIANDGSTIALDWSDPATVSLFGGTVSIFSDGTVDGFKIDKISDGTHTFLYQSIPARFSPTTDIPISSEDRLTYFDNSGFHGVGSVIAGTKTATGTATTTFTVTIGVTMANTTYKVTTEGDNALSSAVHYVNNKTTTTFDIVYLAGLTGAVSIDWIVSP